MKKMFLSILLASATSVVYAQGQAQTQGELTTTTATTATTRGQVQTIQQPKQPPQAAPLVPKEGVVQVAMRTRKPLQLLNPAAPARYGSGQERVTHDPNDPGKPKGISLFAWSF